MEKPQSTQDAYERIRAWFTQEDAVFGYDAEFMGCQYRQGGVPESKTRCAIGCLIPDGLYRYDFEDESLSGLLSKSATMDGWFQKVDSGFLQEAQQCHDRYAVSVDSDHVGDAMRDFIAALDRVAHVYGLKVMGE